MEKHYHGALSKSVKSANKRSGEYYPLIVVIIIAFSELIIIIIVIFIIEDLIPIIAKKWILSKRSLAHFLTRNPEYVLCHILAKLATMRSVSREMPNISGECWQNVGQGEWIGVAE